MGKGGGVMIIELIAWAVVVIGIPVWVGISMVCIDVMRSGDLSNKKRVLAFAALLVIFMFAPALIMIPGILVKLALVSLAG